MKKYFIILLVTIASFATIFIVCDSLLTKKVVRYHLKSDLHWSKIWDFNEVDYPNHYVNRCFVSSRIMQVFREAEDGLNEFRFFMVIRGKEPDIIGEIIDIKFHSSLNREIKVDMKEEMGIKFKLSKTSSSEDYVQTFFNKSELYLDTKNKEIVTVAIKLAIIKKKKKTLKTVTFVFYPETHNEALITV